MCIVLLVVSLVVPLLYHRKKKMDPKENPWIRINRVTRWMIKKKDRAGASPARVDFILDES